MQESKLYVGNLNYAVTEAQLEELFAPYGDVRSVKIVEGRGFGFVEMATPEEAEQAKEALNEALFQGRSLKIDEVALPNPENLMMGLAAADAAVARRRRTQRVACLAAADAAGRVTAAVIGAIIINSPPLPLIRDQKKASAFSRNLAFVLPE